QDGSQLPNNLSCLQSLFLLDEGGKADSESLIAKVISRSKHLRSLEILDLGGCTRIEELPKDIRYLISLRKLMVTTKQTHIQNLTALRELYIEECNNLVSLPQGLKFLATLENLAIVNCEKLDLTMEELELERKEDGSLRKLWIGGVPKLESLPQWILLGSTKTLQHLYIGELENWRMSQEGMQHLTALKRLMIGGCPKLSKRCIEETGEDWPKIAHVVDIIVES
ncbi:hypothetical protein Goarm_022018, partial [Gossypium armourianum]|nr:hypothetical protein [Gossypium armourianum]